MKKNLIVSLLLFVASATVFASHTDEHAENTRNYLNYIDRGVAQYLYDNGVTKLTADKTNFEGKLKRWHIALLLKRLFKDYKQLPAMAGERNCDFEDIYMLAGNDQSELIEACQYGIMQGSQGLMRPNDEILREHVYIILARLTSKDGAVNNLDAALKILDEKRLAVDGEGARGVAVYPIERGQMYQHIMDILYRIYEDKKIIRLYEEARAAFPDDKFK